MPAEIFAIILEAYAAAGLLFAGVFVVAGIEQVDPLSKGSSIGFGLIILPGLAALWPVMLTRWIRRKGARNMIQPLRRNHFLIWIGLAVLLPILFAAGLLARRPTTPNNSAVHWEQSK